MERPAWNITAKVAADEDDKTSVGSITFTFERDDFVAVVEFSDADSSVAGDWNALLTPGGHTYEFCNSNGNVSVHSNGSAVTFEVSKYGYGGDGAITITAPLAACRGAIESVRRAVAEIQSTRIARVK